MDEATNRRTHSDIISANLVLVATLSLFLLMLMKVTRVANLNLPTAYAILSTTGPVNVALGALTLTLPLLFIGMLSLSSLAYDPSSSIVSRATGHLVASLIVAISSFLTPFYFTLMLAVFYLSQFIARKLANILARKLRERDARRSGSVEHRIQTFRAHQLQIAAYLEERPSIPAAKAESEANTEHDLATVEKRIVIAEGQLALHQRHLEEDQEQLEEAETLLAEMEQLLATERAKHREYHQLAIVAITAVALLPLILTILYSTRLWLPAERFDITDGSTIVGYTLASDGEWHSVLLESTRTVQHLRPATIASRGICSVDKEGPDRSIVDYILRNNPAPRYPSCTLQE